MAENNFHEDLRNQMLKNSDEYNSQNKDNNKEFLELLKELEVLSKKGIYKKCLRISGTEKAYYFANKLCELSFSVVLQDWMNFDPVPCKALTIPMIITWAHPNIRILNDRGGKIV